MRPLCERHEGGTRAYLSWYWLYLVTATRTRHPGGMSTVVIGSAVPTEALGPSEPPTNDSPMVGDRATSQSRDAARRDELAAFLRNRRERLSPQDIGLLTSGRRRTPGLRREEVA